MGSLMRRDKQSAVSSDFESPGQYSTVYSNFDIVVTQCASRLLLIFRFSVSCVNAEWSV